MKTLAGMAAVLLTSVSLATAQEQDDNRIAAPVGDNVSGQAIERQAPPSDVAPAGTVPDNALLAPGYMETTTPPNLPPRKLTKEELDAIRQGMVDNTIGSILTPGEVGRVRDATLGSQSAAVRPTYSTDPYPKALPRVVNAEKSPQQQAPSVRLAYGLQTPVTFVDEDGFPWPVASVTYNPMMIAQDGNGCGSGGSVATPPDGRRPTTINLTPCYFEVFGNVNVLLEDWTYPIVLVSQSGFRPTPGSKDPVSIDMPLTVVVGGHSPLAKKVKPVAIKKTTLHKVVKKGPVVTGDFDLAHYISGRPPAGARSIKIGASGVRGYVAPDGDLVVVGRIEMMTPHYNSRASTPDGEKAYRFEGVPYRVFFVDRNGTEIGATINF